ncbi:MAG: hypothetical protein GWM92_05505, partial [Gemmatimonadetes bacterium]|nr:hypothetical protein [Gemmatimonadota bacterium]NIR78039.1 hypothetical protein [Gemmatimonadota bacterium]NIT86600.1 hypothetical protein [Gemmatimonadota bacterium]NIU30445.1 hypothetical protein [Gemmatimonadota bacterium]NIU35309.1 hypothetical protein [Gemmatimonadota bacterium]
PAPPGNRIEPRVLGLPFFLFWCVLWVFLIFAGIVVPYVGCHGEKG